mgnify:CR=1 FL=1
MYKRQLYLFIYLIIPYSAITQTLKVDFIRNLENSLNKRDLEFIRKNFRNDENKNIPKQFSKIINDFPDSKWKIKRLKSNIPNKEILRINAFILKISLFGIFDFNLLIFHLLSGKSLIIFENCFGIFLFSSFLKFFLINSKSRLFNEFSRFLIKSTFKVCVIAE